MGKWISPRLLFVGTSMKKTKGLFCGLNFFIFRIEHVTLILIREKID